MPVIFPIITGAIGVSNLVTNLLREDVDPNEIREIKQNIERVIQGQTRILNRLELIIGEMPVLTQLGQTVTDIEYAYNQMKTFRPGMEDIAKEWAERNLDISTGMDSKLYVLHQVMMGQDRLSEPLMKLFRKRVESDPTGQSNHWEFINYLSAWQFLQFKALAVMTNAMRVLEPDLSDDDLKRPLQRHDDWIQKESQLNAKILQGINEFYVNPALSQNRFFIGPMLKLNTQAVVTEAGFLVTGLKFVEKADCISLEIHQSRPLPYGLVDPKGGGWKNNTDQEVKPIVVHALNIAPTAIEQRVTSESPRSQVVTGVRLHHGYRLALEVETCEFDWMEGVLNESTRSWLTPKNDGQEIHLKVGEQLICNYNPVLPAPGSCITGVGLFSSGNYLALRVRTRFLEI
jgi:hypothetical protein